MIESPDSVDPELSVPIFSLYSHRRSPSPDQIEMIDLLLIDLQDVGCRVYTYIWTMYLAMEACAKAGKSVAVLDRPNPVGGQQVEGNLLEEQFRSFVGLAPIAMRHGMTIGELALYFKRLNNWDLDLHVVAMKGWRRGFYYDQTGLPWVIPSPNMPCLETAIVYPGQVMLEATNISEGRGTTRPFEIFGAPWIEASRLRNRLDYRVLKGMTLREQVFEPTFNKWQGMVCNGFQIHVMDRRLYRPYTASLELLRAIISTYSEHFAWKGPPYEYEFEKMPIDVITGSPHLQSMLENGCEVQEIEKSWRTGLEEFMAHRAEVLIYGE